jgi:hypothetical protein
MNGKGLGGLHAANQGMVLDMAKASGALMRSHPFLSPVIAAVTALLVPFYYAAVAGPGAVYYGIINGR